ncbi:gliding motility-associated C-terminal domain-containing protein [Myroides odoratus]|uniref:gliding motility-associated C-terminal domain-containing protein n=1 Tax=Myroides odoratus TaxID=256 RepID=UPI0039B016F8
MKTSIRYIVYFYLWTPFVFAQVSVDKNFTNEGDFIVLEGAILSSDYPFENTLSGNFENRGNIYFYQDFKNDNLFYPGVSVTRSKVYFSSLGTPRIINISGTKLSEFQDIEFDNTEQPYSFLLSNEIAVQGESTFISGVIKVVDKEGMFTFLPDSKTSKVSDYSHVEGEVEKIGKNGFQYPIGDKNFFRPASISAPKEVEDAIVTQYYLEDHAFFDTHKITSGVIHTLNEKEYWRLEGKLKSSKNIVLSLSWDDRTTPPELLKDPENELHIVRWDAHKQLWVDEGGVVDMSSKRITTVSEIKDFGYFTLATVKKDWVLDGDVVIYNLVTPDGDGKNDYFIIDNIKKYPNNRVEIYNRWGVKVYETTNYDPLGDGSTNVFTGYSEGKITVDKSKKLPSGTYYYVVTYEYTDANGSRMIKKAANLHLETN